jgi:hypothetical protein
LSIGSSFRIAFNSQYSPIPKQFVQDEALKALRMGYSLRMKHKTFIQEDLQMPRQFIQKKLEDP